MSDAFIVLVPKDPHWKAPAEVQQRVATILGELVPSAEIIATDVTEEIRFNDAGSNFASTQCSKCGAQIRSDWWQERMEKDFNGKGFRLARYPVPCCGAELTLDELTYSFPQKFGCTSWTAQNPNVAQLPDSALQELQTGAGTALVIVYRHL